MRQAVSLAHRLNCKYEKGELINGFVFFIAGPHSVRTRYAKKKARAKQA
jgi:hypothetical protein